jgi:hypothetical protein
MSKVYYILKEEHDRLQRLAALYQNEIENLPKGSISLKKRNNNAYMYAAYREGKRMKFDYIGKESSPKAVEVSRLIKKRQEKNKQLCEVRADIREIKKVLNGYSD